ncbi:hypothetical protein DENIS_2250 [Desulfonema ishimotonii]|uniref:NACHT domain-containing protein n=1 Tax=Desulfonema ishimotonii TaxID=45657 RepID=A0A401FWF9_9BACT|nr:pentapeptide repeat-containing protein [Desulfonema ishimotonii]GBC61290.1 hypothetical protein DENIS_2250 [Desulfonema ishimotonii]
MDADRITGDHGYTALRNDLLIRSGQGIFPAIYPVGAPIDTVIGHLRTDCPGYSFFTIAPDVGRPEFVPLFQKASEQPCAGPRLFHVIGIENLPDALRVDFFGYIRHLMMRSDEAPCGIVLWMTPELEEQLFFLVPELYWQLPGLYDFSALMPRRKFPEPSGAPPEKRPALSPEKVGAYLEKVIWQYENWKTVRRQNTPFLIEMMGHADLNAYYAPTCFTNKKGRTFLVDDLLNVFLENRTINFLTLLGDAGTGKSAFALHYFVGLARHWLRSPGSQRIPVFISLRGYAGRLSTEEFLIEEFKRIFGVSLSFITLQDLLLRGRFIFFADGFDEMASAGDRYLCAGNLKELAKLSLRNILLENGIEKPQQANKVFLTCRTHYFLTDVREEDTLRAGYTALYQEYAAKENFQMVRMAPRIFDADQIREYTLRSTQNGITARNAVSMMTDPYNLSRLSTQPLLYGMIIRTLPSYRNRKEIGIADLYRAYTDLWISRDDWRFRMKPSGKRLILYQMALKMFRKGGGFFIHFSELEVPEPHHLKGALQGAEITHLRDEMMACEFLSCDSKGNYRFVHRSFMDYFLAEVCFLRIRESGERLVAYDHLEEETRAFLKSIISSEKSNLRNLNLSGLSLEKANLYQADLSGAVMKKIRLNMAVLMNANLQGADLTASDMGQVNLTRSVLKDADLSSANLANARIREADLTHAKLNGSNFHGADLRRTKFRRARLAWADLREADLEGADLTGAVLTDADLTGANLRGAILSEADLTGASLNNAILIRAEAAGVRLTGADCTSADFSDANLAWARLERTNLTLANLGKVRFREANLTGADLRDAECRQADFRRAILKNAKLQGGRMQEADLTGADLSNARLDDADLSWANLNGVQLEKARLTDARLNMAKLRESCLKDADLSGADLTWADLIRADLTGADLRGADLSEADLSGAKLSNADLRGSKLRSVDLSEAEYEGAALEGADLTDARMKPQGE